MSDDGRTVLLYLHARIGRRRERSGRKKIERESARVRGLGKDERNQGKGERE